MSLSCIFFKKNTNIQQSDFLTFEIEMIKKMTIKHKIEICGEGELFSTFESEMIKKKDNYK